MSEELKAIENEEVVFDEESRDKMKALLEMIGLSMVAFPEAHESSFEAFPVSVNISNDENKKDPDESKPFIIALGKDISEHADEYMDFMVKILGRVLSSDTPVKEEESESDVD